MRSYLPIAVFACVCLLSGCGVSSGNFAGAPAAPGNPAAAPPVPQPTLIFRGNVHSGQAPIVGARVYLFAAGTSGYGSASTPLLVANVTGHADATGAYTLTDGDGAFSLLSSAFTCPAGSMIYFLALGGNAGTGTNSANALLSAFGACPGPGYNAAVSPSVWINPATTVAAAFALSGYAPAPTHIGSSGSTLATTGLTNAFATASSLVDTSTGHAYAYAPTGGLVPQTTINALSNILASCINTQGAGSYPCTTLFARSATGPIAPADTASAAINIAHSPGQNVSALFTLQSYAGALFAPTLAAAPSSWVLPVSYTGGGLSSPRSLAIDSEGNVWVANAGNSTLSKFSPTGVPASASGFSGGGLKAPTSLAIDPAGNVWAINPSANSLSELSATGEPLSPATGFTGGGLYNPAGVVIDREGSVWVGNRYDSVGLTSRFSSTGVPLSATGYDNGIAGKTGDLALDAAGSLWVTGPGNNLLSRTSLAPSTAPVTFVGGGLNNAEGVAIDHGGNAWVANPGNSSLTRVSASQPQSALANVTGGGLAGNRSLAIDGAGCVWTASNATGTVSAFANDGTPMAASGYAVAAASSGLWGTAIDGSGNVWVTARNSDALVELVGAAMPVVTPLVQAATSNTLGMRP